MKMELWSLPIFMLANEGMSWGDDTLGELMNAPYRLTGKFEEEAVNNITNKINVFEEFKVFDRGIELKNEQLKKLKKDLSELELSESKYSSVKTFVWELFVVTGSFLLPVFLFFVIIKAIRIDISISIIFSVFAILLVKVIINSYKRMKEHERNLVITSEIKESIQNIEHEITKVKTDKVVKAKELFEKHKVVINQHKTLSRALSFQASFLKFVSINDWVRMSEYFQQKKIERGFRYYYCKAEFGKNGIVTIKSRNGIRALFKYDPDLTQPRISKLKAFYLSFLNSNCEIPFYISNKEFSSKSKDFALENGINLLTTEQFILLVIYNLHTPYIYPMFRYIEEGSKSNLNHWMDDMINQHKKTYEFIKEYLTVFRAPSYEEYYSQLLTDINYGKTCVFDQKPIKSDILETVEERTKNNFRKIIQNGYVYL